MTAMGRPSERMITHNPLARHNDYFPQKDKTRTHTQKTKKKNKFLFFFLALGHHQPTTTHGPLIEVNEGML
jgi:hypothetical protein